MALRAGQGLSAFVLARALPPLRVRFQQLVRGLRNDADRRYALAEINDLLEGLSSSEFVDTVCDTDLRGLSDLVANYLAAMVEHAASRKGVAAPQWTQEPAALEEPYFATDLKSLRLGLLLSSPVAFKRRNIFIDATVGDRV